VAGDIGCRETAARLVVDPQHGAGELQQHFAVMGEAELAAVVFEQGAAGQVLQPADLMGDRRLGAANLSAGRGKSPGIDDRDERPQQAMSRSWFNDKSREWWRCRLSISPWLAHLVA